METAGHTSPMVLKVKVFCCSRVGRDGSLLSRHELDKLVEMIITIIIKGDHEIKMTKLEKVK